MSEDRSIFLSEQDLSTLTGIARGANKRSKFELQAAWLKTAHIPHFVNVRGRPIVARAVVEGAPRAKVEDPAQAWTPAPLRGKQ